MSLNYFLKHTALSAIPFLCVVTLSAQTSLLTADQITLSHSWSQEPDGWDYPISLHIPENADEDSPMPVCIALHGSNSDGSAMVSNLSQWLDCHMVIAPTGYNNGWNLCSESSKAPDIEMLASLLSQLTSFQNVDTNRISLLGLSNGGGLVNQALIELSNYNISSFVAVVSQFNEPQYHNESFHKPISNEEVNPIPIENYCGYTVPVDPANGNRYLSVCNYNDPIIPFEGGAAVGNYFLHATESIYKVAVSQGYSGPELFTGDDIENNLVEYEYLGGDVKMIVGLNYHGMNEAQENHVSSFLMNCITNGIVEDEKQIAYWDIAPNPVKNSITITSESILVDSPYRVTDMQGKIVLEGILSNTSITLNTDHLSNGRYTISLISKNTLLTKPLLIQK